MFIVVQVHDMFFKKSVWNKYEFKKVSWFLINLMFHFLNDNNFKSQLMIHIMILVDIN